MTPTDDDHERWQARVGTTLRDKWTLDRLLGVGGMAAVYAATHKMGRRDAVKILHPEIARSKELRARFEQEARAVTALGHPGAVEVRDIDTAEDGSPFLVMEYLSGEPLGARIERRALSERELVQHMDAVLDVLAAAHARGIVHRDIKPDNLFVTDTGTLKVLDFGIARMRERTQAGGFQTKTGSTLGTVSYMSPEQILGRNVDGRADLFAVGATMFRALTGKRIHAAETESELLVKMGTQPAPPLLSIAPGVDPRVARIVDRALAFDQDARYPDARTMQGDVRAVLRGEDPPFASSAVALAAGAAAPPGADGPTRVPSAVVPAAAVAVGAAVAPGPPSVGVDPTMVGPPSLSGAYGAPGSLAGISLGPASQVSHVPASTGSVPGGAVAAASGPASVAQSPQAPPVVAAIAAPREDARERKGLLVALVIGGLALLVGAAVLIGSATETKPKKPSSATDDDTSAVSGPSSGGLGSLLFKPSSSATAAAKAPTPRPTPAPGPADGKPGGAPPGQPGQPAEQPERPAEPGRPGQPARDPQSDPRLDGVPPAPQQPAEAGGPPPWSNGKKPKKKGKHHGD